MTEHTPPDPSNDAAAQAGTTDYGLDTPEGLRALLIRLHNIRQYFNQRIRQLPLDRPM